MKLALNITAVLLYLSSFWICTLAYPEAFFGDKEASIKFTDLRYSIYSVILTLCLISSNMAPEKRHGIWYLKALKFVSICGIGFCVGDIVDRFLFDITKFQPNDAFVICITFGIAYYKIYVRKH